MKLASFIGYGSKVEDVEFEKNPSHGRRDTEEKVYCFTSKYPFITD